MIPFIQRVFLIPRLLAYFHRIRSKKAFIPLKEARSIGILADFRKSGNMPPVVQFAKAIHKQDRRCHVFLIIPDKRKEFNPFDYEKHFPGMPVELICQDELSLFKAPKKEQHKPFTAKVFDIVFYLETEENFSLQSVLWQSQAKMFAGPEGLCGGVLDFEIGLKERTDLPYLTDNLLKYLHSIQNRQELKIQTESFKLF
ncbi:MAG: hypothetical protein NTV01_12550 [Bacteroidia bacterium]|nr:hypothetical protein [Bacteroidia bacterium]